MLQFRAGTVSNYPASVVSAGLQAVYDLRVGGPTTVGMRSAPTKVLGVDTLPANATYSGGFLIVNGNATFDNWDFSTIASNGYVEVNGTGTVVFNDCKFSWHPSTTSSYCLNSGDTGSPTVTCNYCLFQGIGPNRDSPAAATLTKNGSLTLNYCDFVYMTADGVKSNGGTTTMRYCRLQCPGWNPLSDPDCTQFAGGVIDFQYNLIDIRDGSEIGASFTGQAINNMFRIEAFAANITSVTVKNNIMVGIAGFGTAPSGPLYGGFRSILARGENPYTVSNILYENNVIQRGRNGYVQDSIALTDAEWVNNRDYDNNTIIPKNT